MGPPWEPACCLPRSAQRPAETVPADRSTQSPVRPLQPQGATSPAYELPPQCTPMHEVRVRQVDPAIPHRHLRQLALDNSLSYLSSDASRLVPMRNSRQQKGAWSTRACSFTASLSMTAVSAHTPVRDPRSTGSAFMTLHPAPAKRRLYTLARTGTCLCPSAPTSFYMLGISRSSTATGGAHVLDGKESPRVG